MSLHNLKIISGGLIIAISALILTGCGQKNSTSQSNTNKNVASSNSIDSTASSNAAVNDQQSKLQHSIETAQKIAFKPGWSSSIISYTINANHQIEQNQTNQHIGAHQHPDTNLTNAIWSANYDYYMFSNDFRQTPLQLTYQRLTSHDPKVHGVYTKAVAHQAIKQIFKYFVDNAKFHYRWFPGEGDYFNPQTAMPSGHSSRVEKYYHQKEKTIESKPNSYINRLKRQYKHDYQKALATQMKLNVGTNKHPDNNLNRAIAVMNANLLFISRRKSDTTPLIPDMNTVKLAFQFNHFTKAAQTAAFQHLSNQLISVYQYNLNYDRTVPANDITSEQF